MAHINYTIREAVTDELKVLQEFEQGVIRYERPFALNLKGRSDCLLRHSKSN